MGHFHDLSRNDNPLIINFDEELGFSDLEAAQEDFLRPQRAARELTYADDLVRVYFREMGTVPLLTREGEVYLARRMERGKLRMRKAISRSALAQLVVLEQAEQLKKGSEEIDNLVDLEEGALANTKRRGELMQLFADVVVLRKKQQQMEKKLKATAISKDRTPGRSLPACARARSRCRTSAG